MFLADLLHNAVFMMCLVLRVWMINELFMPVLSGDVEWDPSRQILLMSIALAFHIPEHLLQVLNFRRNYWRGGGATRKTLQTNLMRKYLSYTDGTRESVDHGTIILMLFKDIPEIADEAFGGIFSVAKNVMLLFMMFLYQVLGT